WMLELVTLTGAAHRDDSTSTTFHIASKHPQSYSLEEDQLQINDSKNCQTAKKLCARETLQLLFIHQQQHFFLYHPPHPPIHYLLSITLPWFVVCIFLHSTVQGFSQS
ncbi:hypothetical protein ILYODFUR_020928, partial [Ilyodon furcidens]